MKTISDGNRLFRHTKCVLYVAPESSAASDLHCLPPPVTSQVSIPAPLLYASTLKSIHSLQQKENKFLLFGSHTWNHNSLSYLTASEDNRQASKQWLCRARRYLTHTDFYNIYFSLTLTEHVWYETFKDMLVHLYDFLQDQQRACPYTHTLKNKFQGCSANPEILSPGITVS